MSRMRWVALAWFFAVGNVGVDGRAGEPCKLATKGDSPVARACKEGGVEQAKKLMRSMRAKVNQYRNPRINCKDCHDHDADDRFDTLTKDGRDRFTAFLAEYERKK
jgi:hypothetical protein